MEVGAWLAQRGEWALVDRFAALDGPVREPPTESIPAELQFADACRSGDSRRLAPTDALGQRDSG
jgi:hypothetical protein